MRDTGQLGIYVIPAEGGSMTLLTRVARRIPQNAGRLVWSPDSRYIAFATPVDRDDKHTDIHIVSLETKEVRAITTDGKDNSGPFWLPDSKHIVYHSRRGVWLGDSTRLWVQSIDGGDAERWSLGEGVNALYTPLWSPNGKWVLYAGYRRDRTSGFFVARTNAAGNVVGESVLLKEAKFNVGRRLLRWTKDDRIFYFWEDHRERNYLVDLHDGNQSNLIPDTGMSLHRFQWTHAANRLFIPRGKGGEGGKPGFLSMDSGAFAPIPIEGFEGAITDASISPDGEQLAFSGMDLDSTISEDTMMPTGGVYVYRVPTSGGVPTRLTHSNSYDMLAHWSPDGKRLAFVRGNVNRGAKDFGATLCVIPAMGGPVQTLVEDVFCPETTWSPDGSTLAYMALHPRKDGIFNPDEMEGDIYLIPSTGGQPRQITHTPEREESLSWSPDGNWLAFRSKGEDWIVEVATGQAKRLHEMRKILWAVPGGWLPDGNTLLAIGHSTQSRDGDRRTFWQIPMDGEPVEMNTAAPSSSPIALSPDGTHVMFRENRSEGQYWVVDGVKAFLAAKMGGGE